ncbi:YceI family protein [Ornithinicoccus hortensis]|uniref:Polyisoprenoid-binding protein YceI n=1 Tax=Ornithinicoccus hortensis TaxID=82346 RepID=A0A542YUH2_9MICO|nr:YceI family protein [Ornithinicoccus hortensis]TQL51738.1 polyisoprenoid-binding protein YceI [Ornithinicoccus hortensis]
MGIFSKNKANTAVIDEPVSSATDDIAGDYTLDVTHTRLGFVARHAMVTKVRGQFQEFEGTAHIDTTDVSKSWAKVTIQTGSVFTAQAQRDEHLRNSDFFEVDTYPTITFVSTDVARGEDGEYVITGDLTIKDVTKSVTIPFEPTGSATDPFGNLRVGFEGSLVVNRKDWGLDWNAALETGGVLVSEKVTLEFDISAIRG